MPIENKNELNKMLSLLQSLESYSRRNKSTQSFMIPVITMIHASLQAEQTCSACNIFFDDVTSRPIYLIIKHNGGLFNIEQPPVSRQTAFSVSRNTSPSPPTFPQVILSGPQRQPMNRPTAYLSINSKVDRKGTALPCPYQCADKYRYDDD